MPSDYEPPDPKKGAFTCPHCNAYSYHVSGQVHTNNYLISNSDEARLNLSKCFHCKNLTVWMDGNLIYPDTATAPMPRPDMPDDVKADYLEARSIVVKSPKGAAALLRLAVQKLCVHLGEPGQNINTDIASLVQKGLPSTVQKAFDATRIVGNEAVHPGTINFNDTPDMANAVFGLLNFIVEDRITRPKAIEEVYNLLPEDKRKGVEDRDKKAKLEPT